MESGGQKIHGVIVKPLNVMPDERGFLMEIMRCDDMNFSKFGQMYLTSAFPGVVKAWHWHEFQDDNFCVVKGMAKVALYDRREDSQTFRSVMEFFIGEKNPCVIHIPRGVMHGYKCIGVEPCLLINLVTEPYNYAKPDENRYRWDAQDIPYTWTKDVNG